MHTKLTVNGVDLPSPTKISPGMEQLWSGNTGRSVKTGTMLGAVIAEKQTLDVEWVNVTAAEYKKIINALHAGYFGPVIEQSSEGDVITTLAKAYRNTLSSEDKGFIGGIHYYSSVKVTIIEK